MMSAKGALVCGGVMWAVSAAAGQVVFSQPNDRAGQPSFFSDAVPGQFFSARLADNFSLGTATTVTGVTWWGGSQNFQFADIVNMQSWTVRIYGDDGTGRVDLSNEVFSGTFTAAESNATQTGQLIFNGGIQYRHEISTGEIALAAGNYWLSVGATLEEPNADAWVWSGSTVGDLRNATDFFIGSGFTTFDNSFNDLAFEINGRVIPAPAGAAVLVAMGGFVARRRRVA